MDLRAPQFVIAQDESSALQESLDKISEPLEMAKALNGLLSDPSLTKALEVIADNAEPTSLAELLAWGKEHPPTVRVAGDAIKEARLATEGSEDDCPMQQIYGFRGPQPQVCLYLFCMQT